MHHSTMLKTGEDIKAFIADIGDRLEKRLSTRHCIEEALLLKRRLYEFNRDYAAILDSKKSFGGCWMNGPDVVEGPCPCDSCRIRGRIWFIKNAVNKLNI